MYDAEINFSGSHGFLYLAMPTWSTWIRFLWPAVIIMDFIPTDPDLISLPWMNAREFNKQYGLNYTGWCQITLKNSSFAPIPPDSWTPSKPGSGIDSSNHFSSPAKLNWSTEMLHKMPSGQVSSVQTLPGIVINNSINVYGTPDDPVTLEIGKGLRSVP